MLASEVKEYASLYNLSIEELINRASKITQENFGNSFEFCSLISAKTGKCGENCKYCSQSSHYRTDIETFPLVSVEEVVKSALDAKDKGATRFSIVTSGKTPETDKDFPKMLDMIRAIEKIDGLSSCASIGILNEEEAKLLKEAGLTRFHHNINTSRSFYPSICTTHTYQDRIDSVKIAQKYGIEVCCGAILGMGESREQRIEIALEIRDLNVESAPINFLYPIPGTPLEGAINEINEDEILKTLAIYRIIMPKVVIRYAGGRSKRFSKEYQKKGIEAGVNGILIGNLLTTIGISPEEDKEMIKSLGKKLIHD